MSIRPTTKGTGRFALGSARLAVKAAAAALLGLLATAAPAAASDTANAVAVGMVSTAFSTIACFAFGPAFGPEDPDEVRDEDMFARPGWLLGLSGVYGADTRESKLQNKVRNQDDQGSAPTRNFSLKDSFGVKGQAGYRCHSRFSAEVDVEWMDGFDGTVFEDGAGKIATTEFETVVVTTSLKGYALTGRYQPYGLLGGGAMVADSKAKQSKSFGNKTTDTTTSIVMRFGCGLDFYYTENVVLNLGIDYLLPFGDLEDLDYVSIGLGVRYRF